MKTVPATRQENKQQVYKTIGDTMTEVKQEDNTIQVQLQSSKGHIKSILNNIKKAFNGCEDGDYNLTVTIKRKKANGKDNR